MARDRPKFEWGHCSKMRGEGTPPLLCTDAAKELAEKHGIEMVNETGLARLLESSNATADPGDGEIPSRHRKALPEVREKVGESERVGPMKGS
jgi:hypothetical protein